MAGGDTAAGGGAVAADGAGAGVAATAGGGGAVTGDAVAGGGAGGAGAVTAGGGGRPRGAPRRGRSRGHRGRGLVVEEHAPFLAADAGAVRGGDDQRVPPGASFTGTLRATSLPGVPGSCCRAISAPLSVTAIRSGPVPPVTLPVSVIRSVATRP